MARVRRAAIGLVVELSMRRMIAASGVLYQFGGRLARSGALASWWQSVLPERVYKRAHPRCCLRRWG